MRSFSLILQCTLTTATSPRWDMLNLITSIESPDWHPPTQIIRLNLSVHYILDHWSLMKFDNVHRIRVIKVRWRSMTYAGVSSCTTPRHWVKNGWSPVTFIGVHQSAMKAMQQSVESDGIHQCLTKDAVVHCISVARLIDHQQSSLYFTDLTRRSVLLRQLMTTRWTRRSSIDLKGTYPVYFRSFELACNIRTCMLLAGLLLHVACATLAASD